VAGGKVFIVDHQGGNDVVKALDLKTGKEAWSFAYPDATSHNYGFARATPAYAGGKVYTLSRGGKLHCLDAASGSKLWLRELGAEFGGVRPKWDYSATPLVDGNRVVVCPGGATGLAVLDAATGKTLLTGGKGGPPGYATPVVATIGGQRQYVIFAGKELYGADTASGRTLWSVPWVTAHDVNAATPVVIDNFVFITSGYGVGCGMVKVSGSSASVVWKSAEIQAHFSSSLYLNRFLYGTGDPGNLVCLNPQDGKAMWKQPGFEKGGLVAVDGCLIVISGNTGDVVLVKATHEGYEELGRVTPLGGQSWTAPVVAQGKLLVRNTQSLACLDLQ
jgi:outer membrane protein assembly factor BamB